MSWRWINYKNAYDVVPHSWLKEPIKSMQLANNLKKPLFDTIERWKTILKTNNQILGEINIKRRIFQRVTLSPLLFVIVLIP